MKPSSQYPSSFSQSISREDLLLILETSYKTASFRFLRQASLIWLSAYPGDLAVNLWLGKGLIGEGKRQQAMPILEKLVRLDPEFALAHETLAQTNLESQPDLANQALANAHAAGIKTTTDPNMPGWIRLLRRARRLLQENRLDEAEKVAQQILTTEPENILAAILQIQLVSARKDAPTQLGLAQAFRSRWPDCLHFALFEADALLATGDEAGAVNLLHRCVVNDSAGQVPARIWGDHFTYQPLWPYPLETGFDLPVPAEVAGMLGWNLLPSSIDELENADTQDDQVKGVTGENPVEPEIRIIEPIQVDSSAFINPEAGLIEDTDAVFPFLEKLLASEEAEGPETIEETPVDGSQGDESGEAAGNADTEQGKENSPQDETPEYRQRPAEVPSTDQLQEEADVAGQAVPVRTGESMRDVQEEFERMAKRLKRPGLGRADGRFPVYVILSTETGLKEQYGTSTLSVIDKELHRLSEQIRKRSGWDAVVFYPDGAECAANLSQKQVDGKDPWKIKLAVADLDAALAKKGEMIGALLIVGGPEVVPFHHLPNPTDDMDSQISSDNPYATLDSNYFIPDWPVGRLPGETGNDSGLLLEQIRKLVRYHGKNAQSAKRKSLDFWSRVRVFLAARRAGNKQDGSFGYTAAVWRRSSLAVYRPIGEAGTLLICPPLASGSLPSHKPAALAYYNLHGLVDAAEWYGQRDLGDKNPGPDYPVAFGPKDLGSKMAAPEIIFSEACYGAHIEGKSENQAMALKFMARGALAMVGSTSAAYGSVTTPLIGADLLGNFFWKGLKAGSTVGEALLQAKVDLVREMSRRQGFLDGEDQKTLISFVLYGDPLARMDTTVPVHKSILRAHAHPIVKTISDRQDEDTPVAPVPQAVLKQVKNIVSEYLPGLENAEMHLSEQEVSKGDNHSKDAKNVQPDDSGRVVITMHKDFPIGQKVHHQYARVTLDQKGKMIKIALSR